MCIRDSQITLNALSSLPYFITLSRFRTCRLSCSQYHFSHILPRHIYPLHPHSLHDLFISSVYMHHIIPHARTVKQEFPATNCSVIVNLFSLHSYLNMETWKFTQILTKNESYEDSTQFERKYLQRYVAYRKAERE